MTIYAYTGLPGSGKSYDMVANQILPALQQGRPVIANLPLNLEAVYAKCPGAEIRDFPLEQIKGTPEAIDGVLVPGALVVIDEAWEMFPAGLKVNNAPEPLKNWLAKHRHMVDAQGRSMQVVIGTQDLAQISAYVKPLIDKTFMHTKLSHVGASGSYRIDVYQGARNFDKMAKEARLQEVFGQYKKEIFDLYQSHTMRQSEGSGANEKALDTRAVIWKRPGIIAGGLICLVAVSWAVPTIAGLFVDDAPAVSTPIRQNSGASAPVARVRGPDWRIAGFVDQGQNVIVLLSSSDGQHALMDGRECRRSRFIAECEYLGQVVRLAGLPRMPVEDNRPFTSALAEKVSASTGEAVR